MKRLRRIISSTPTTPAPTPMPILAPRLKSPLVDGGDWVGSALVTPVDVVGDGSPVVCEVSLADVAEDVVVGLRPDITNSASACENMYGLESSRISRS